MNIISIKYKKGEEASISQMILSNSVSFSHETTAIEGENDKQCGQSLNRTSKTNQAKAFQKPDYNV